MAYVQECESCRCTLRIPDGLASEWLTCPRCLAKVMNPGSVGRGAAPRACPQCKRNNSAKAARCLYCGVDLDAPIEPPAPPPDTMICPFCAEDIPRRRKICPRCKEWLSDIHVDEAVHRDTTFLGRILLPLAAIGGCGVFLFLAGADYDAPAALRGLVTVAFAGMVVAGFVLNLKKENKAAQGIGRLILGGLAAAGAIVLAVFILAFAALVYLLVVCSFGGMRIGG